MTNYYQEDTSSGTGTTCAAEQHYVSALYRIAKKHGIKTTEEMILKEIRQPKRFIKTKTR